MPFSEKVIRFVRQSKVGYQKKAFTNLVKWTNKLMNNQHRNKIHWENLKSKIERETVLADKKWLLEQVMLQLNHN